MSHDATLDSAARADVLTFNPQRPDFCRAQPRPPLLSIGIPAYNRPHLLREALASIARQRVFDDFEVIVCDDGGLPETRRVVESSPLPNIRFFVNRPRLGAIGNWNRCLSLATGRWVTLLHEDDALYSWFLAAITPSLRPEVVAVATRCVQADQPPPIVPSRHRPARRPYAPAWFLKSSMTPFPGVVFSREVALRIGGFDARHGGIADYVFWYELARAGRVELVRQTSAFYRVMFGQWTEREWPAMLRTAHLLRLRIAREQLPQFPRLGRWFARFFSGRMARAYGRRFPERPAGLQRALKFRSILLGRLPSGWVWKLLQVATALAASRRAHPIPIPSAFVPATRDPLPPDWLEGAA